MQINRKDIGYTIYSRFEEAFRLWLGEKIQALFGSKWKDYIPKGIFNKIQDGSSCLILDEIEDVALLLDETDMPDLMEIVCFNKKFSQYIPNNHFSIDDFRNKMSTIYYLRCKIAHVKQNFSAFDLDLLMAASAEFITLFDEYGYELKNTIDCIKDSPEKVIIQIPPSFFIMMKDQNFQTLRIYLQVTMIPMADLLEERKIFLKLLSIYLETSIESLQFRVLEE